MRLLSASASPYGRKVKMTAIIKGLKEQIEMVTADTRPVENPELSADNPLAKIPVLVLSDGTSLYDSKVICEYLDAQVATNVLFPGEGPARWRTLTLGALGDGILDAALLTVYEKRFRPEEKWHDDWLQRQHFKIDNALKHLEANADTVLAGNVDYGTVTVAAALGYLEFREVVDWRAGHPKLAAWLDGFAQSVPAYGATKPE